MIHTTYYEQVPPKNRVVTCPYCNKEQNMHNIPLQMHTSKMWIAHDCENCGKVFGYIQIVERIYVVVQTKEQEEETK